MKIDTLDNEQTDEPPLSGGKFEVAKVRNEMNEDAPKTEPFPQIIYTYVDKNTNLNLPSQELRQAGADDTDENILH